MNTCECGKSVELNQHFCNSCGKKLNQPIIFQFDTAESWSSGNIFNSICKFFRHPSKFGRTLLEDEKAPNSLWLIPLHLLLVYVVNLAYSYKTTWLFNVQYENSVFDRSFQEVIVDELGNLFFNQILFMIFIFVILQILKSGIPFTYLVRYNFFKATGRLMSYLLVPTILFNIILLILLVFFESNQVLYCCTESEIGNILGTPATLLEHEVITPFSPLYTLLSAAKFISSRIIIGIYLFVIINKSLENRSLISYLLPLVYIFFHLIAIRNRYGLF
ncbi:MAG: hypothetical protein OEZ01_15540 [Candidatus Heimdallarchaeota archaeon]|nr:hypothetical protein [Candidatus Heimdallarchaeota archaeon]MDH5647422.1 hypothetical protein [Candidatus Heimdallarchaeota archaeon]